VGARPLAAAGRGDLAQRIPAALRAGTLTVSYSIVLASGFLALIAAGPLLERVGPDPVFAGVAAAQTAAAALVGRMALRMPALHRST
jgi:hypothetical protein